MEKLLWEYVDIPIQNGESDEILLERFIGKYDVYGKIYNQNKNNFKIKFSSSSLEEKNKLLLDGYLYYKSFNAILSIGIFFQNELDLSQVNSGKVIRELNNLKSGKFSLKNKLLFRNRVDLLILYKPNKKNIFREGENWKSKLPGTYLIISIYKDRILLRDVFRAIKKSTSKKIAKTAMFPLKMEQAEVRLLKTNFKKKTEDIASINDLRTISFIAEKLDEHPILHLICRRDCKNICKQTMEFIKKGNLKEIDKIRNFSFYLKKSDKTIKVNVKHEGITKFIFPLKIATLKFDISNIDIRDIEYLESKGLFTNTLYFEERKRNLKEEIDYLLYSKQLNFYEEVLLKDLIEKFERLNLIVRDRKNNVLIKFNLDGFLELLISYLLQKDFKIKILENPKIGKSQKYLALLDTSREGEHFIVVIFSKTPSENTIRNFKSKWAFGLSNPPLMIIPKEDDYEKIKLFRSFPHLNFSEVLYSIENNTFGDKISEILNNIRKQYRLERIKEVPLAIKKIEQIIEDKKTKEKSSETENNIFYLIDLLFASTIKIGQGYLPDGIRLSPAFKDKSFIWDSKVWMNSLNTQTERDKIARYILTSLKDKQSNQFGRIKKYLFPGYLKNPKELEKIFKDSKKIASRQFRLHKVRKKDILDFDWGYIDFRFLGKILSWMNSKSDTIIYEIGFYKILTEYIFGEKILDIDSANRLIEIFEKEIKRITSSKINLNEFRKKGKSTKKIFDSNKTNP